MPGPLVTGIAIGPFALGWIPDSEEERYLAEFGVVFLMFSIGLEFSLPRLHTVLVTPGAAAVGRSLEELALDELLVDVVAIRRQGGKGVEPRPDTRIQAGDVLVLRGAADGLAAAEFRVLQG